MASDFWIRLYLDLKYEKKKCFCFVDLLEAKLKFALQLCLKKKPKKLSSQKTFRHSSNYRFCSTLPPTHGDLCLFSSIVSPCLLLLWRHRTPPNRFNLASAEPSNVLVSNCTRVCREFSTLPCHRIFGHWMKSPIPLRLAYKDCRLVLHANIFNMAVSEC